MNDKELREIRRRFRPDKINILKIKGCLVNSEKTVVSRFSQPIASCSQEENEKLLGIIKKSLSGGLGTNLLGLEFTAEQTMQGEEHRLLMELRKSSLENEDALTTFYQKVIESVNIDGGYVILLACDNYDVFSYSADGEKADSSEMFSYFVCGVCPVKPLNAGLYFRQFDNSFRAIEEHAMLSAPEMGFMFPSFDDRAANIYSALYYTKDIGNIHPEFIQNVFGVRPPMSAPEQKDGFDSCLKDTLQDECDFNVLCSVHNQISEMVEEHKNSKEEEPLKLSKHSLKTVLEYCGVDGEKVEQFGNKFEEEFGKNAQITPKSIVDVKKFELATPDVSIKVNPARTDLVTTQIINGVKYILIRANEGVEVNGINIDIK